MLNDSGGSFQIDAATGVVTVAGSLDFETAGSHTIEVEATSTDGSSRSEEFTIAVLNVSDAVISARSIYYSDSTFDAAGTLDGVAGDKSPLFEGGVATFENYTSYSSGINGIVLQLNDLNNIPTTANVDDFLEFRVGNDNNTSTWAAAPTPTNVVFVDGGISADDRVFLTWNDNAIQNQWLQIRILANDATGLTAEDGRRHFLLWQCDRRNGQLEHKCNCQFN